MGRLLMFLLLIVLAVVGLGLYLGWFEFSSSGDTDGKRDIKLTIDTSRIKSDVEGVEQRIKKAIRGTEKQQ